MEAKNEANSTAALTVRRPTDRRTDRPRVRNSEQDEANNCHLVAVETGRFLRVVASFNYLGTLLVHRRSEGESDRH